MKLKHQTYYLLVLSTFTIQATSFHQGNKNGKLRNLVSHLTA